MKWLPSVRASKFLNICSTGALCVHVRLSMCACAFVSACLCVHVRLSVCACVCMCVCQCVLVCACAFVSACLCVHVRLSVCACVCMCACQCVLVCACLCVCKQERESCKSLPSIQTSQSIELLIYKRHSSK